MTDKRAAPRVAAFHPNAELYGADRVFLEFIRAVAPIAQLRVYLAETGPLVDAIGEFGDPPIIRRRPVLRRQSLRGPRLFRTAAALVLDVFRVARWVRRLDCDLVYVSTISLPSVVMGARLAGCYVVCHVHEAEDQVGRIQHALLTAPLLAAHELICISHSVETSTARTWSSLVGRSAVIYNGVSPGEGTTPLSVRQPKSAQLVLVGRLSHRKGQDLAIRAVRLLRDRGVEVHLRLVGDVYTGYEHVETALHSLVEDLDVEQFVEFMGFDPVPVRHYQLAHIVLVPSRQEPFGLVAVEGLMSGRVVIASAVEGLCEIIVDRVNGRLTPRDDPGALAALVEDVLQNWEASTGLAADGRLDALNRFGIDRFRSDVQAFVAEVTSRAGRP